MPFPPAHPKIYHIVHIENLASIVADGCLWSDAKMRARQGGTVIGMNVIKERRLRLPVTCHRPSCVGDYVPFYFCSRSVMLYVIHCRNNPELSYRGGQEPIVHLESDLHNTINWAESQGLRWAFSLSNAGAMYAQFRSRLDRLHEINWEAVSALDFRAADIKEGKQAEFLVETLFPWSLVARIGVNSLQFAQQVANITIRSNHRPAVEIRPDWYYQVMNPMLSYTTGDILKSDAEALVNTVNCVGIMGRGIALQFKNAFPANFKAYVAACKRDAVQPGKMFVFETGTLTLPKYIVNFPTKRHWRGNSRMEDIEAGLEALVEEIRSRGIRSIAVPPLGAGLGGLPWNEVRERIQNFLGHIEGLHVIVYEPAGAPSSEVIARAPEVPKMTPGRAALVALIYRYLGGMMDPFVTLLEVHKLMYFMQEAGAPLRLNYVKHYYGPYAQNLTHVLRAVEGYFISGYADGGDQPDKTLELVPGAHGDALRYLESDEQTKARLNRVSDLVGGFETPFGLELLATVHWIAKHEGISTSKEVTAKVRAWNDRKKRFSQPQITIALRTLKKKGWLEKQVSQ
jgi:O-acetyl-ADP-ribose deacetylase (regulator of RNase III)